MLNSNILIKLVIFRVEEQQLQVLLEKGRLPHTPLITNMAIDEIAKELCTSHTGLAIGPHYLEQLYTFSEKKEIAIVYYVLVSPRHQDGSGSFVWQDISTIAPEDPDGETIHYAKKRLAWKVEYTNVVYSLLPEQFTLTQLQDVYQIILGHTIDKRNFRKKIMSLDFIEPTGEKHIAHARPAQMYRFKSRKATMVKVFS